MYLMSYNILIGVIRSFNILTFNKQMGEVLPYIFEPQADKANGPAGSMSDDSSSGGDDSSGTEEEDAVDNPERIGNTNW